jgi:bacterioferritin
MRRKRPSTPRRSPSASCSSAAKPDFSPDNLTQRSHADYDESSDLNAMIRSNLVAERVAIEAYSQMIALIGEKDVTTRRVLESILSQEQEHADELSDWLSA